MTVSGGQSVIREAETMIVELGSITEEIFLRKGFTQKARHPGRRAGARPD
jgi:hypothetical protein